MDIGKIGQDQSDDSKSLEKYRKAYLEKMDRELKRTVDKYKEKHKLPDVNLTFEEIKEYARQELQAQRDRQPDRKPLSEHQIATVVDPQSKEVKEVAQNVEKEIEITRKITQELLSKMPSLSKKVKMGDLKGRVKAQKPEEPKGPSPDV